MNSEEVVWESGDHRVVRDKYCYIVQSAHVRRKGKNKGEKVWRYEGYYGTLTGVAKKLLTLDIGFTLEQDWHEYTRLLDAAAERIAAAWVSE